MRYQKVLSQIWNDEKFSKLTASQQRLFLYILTCPHGNLIGMFVLKMGYMADDLRDSPKNIEKDLRKIIDTGSIVYDFSTQVVLIKRFLRHNPLTNPNQVKAAKKMIVELPKTVLFQQFMEVLPEVLKEAFKEVISKPEYISVSDSVSEEDKGGVGGEEKEPKNKHGDFVELTLREYQKLSEKYGTHIQDIIDFFNTKIGSKGLKKWRKEHESDYFTILNWDNNNWIPGSVTGQIGWAKE